MKLKKLKFKKDRKRYYTNQTFNNSNMCPNTFKKTQTHNHEGIRYNTSYYRRNKNKRFCVHKCPHCNYETTGPKQALKAHIWSKHTPEHQRPFQCPCHHCSRGFASKANLIKHIEKYHNIKMHKHNKNILAFKIITLHQIILPEKLPENISMEDFYYDIYSKTISIKSYTRNSLKKIYRENANIDLP